MAHFLATICPPYVKNVAWCAAETASLVDDPEEASFTCKDCGKKYGRAKQLHEHRRIVSIKLNYHYNTISFKYGLDSQGTKAEATLQLWQPHLHSQTQGIKDAGLWFCCC